MRLSSTRLLASLVGLLTIIGVVGIAQSLPRRAWLDRTGWSEIAPSDLRVAGVFADLQSHGLGAALDSLKAQSSRDSLVLRAGHQLAHALGRQALLANHADAAVIGECRPLFSSGCYHGVVEAYLGVRGTIDMPALDAMCRKAGDEEHPGPVHECMHGLGHGILGALRMNATQSLHYCEQLELERYATSCYEGVFMEAVSSALHHPHRHPGQVHTRGSDEHASSDMSHGVIGRLAIDSSDPYSPCRSVQAPYARSCWLFQGFLILRRVAFNARKAFDLCAAAPAGWAPRCAESVGHQLTGLFQQDDGWIRSKCNEATGALVSSCIEGALYALVAGDWSGASGVRLCASLEKAHTFQCFRALGPLLQAVAPKGQQASACGRAEPAFQVACMSSRGPT